ncbi:hypothetical protein ACIBCS_27740 [Streptomyces phaeochromogenes]|uniref:hypothetical protein n=1 Tax=Streptomyces phaeochromogenes TaxID=1923 RepID=UPI0037BD7DE3
MSGAAVSGARVVSLKVDIPQSIPADGNYHVVRFPYPDQPYDPWSMHTAAQPDGSAVTNWKTDDRSGLIWPSVSGWGVLTSLIYWEAGNYSELRDRYVRDPLGVYDSTATEHRPPSPGIQCFHKTHEIFVHPDVPLALLVAHDATSARKLTLAEFKLAIHPVEEA